MLLKLHYQQLSDGFSLMIDSGLLDKEEQSISIISLRKSIIDSSAAVLLEASGLFFHFFRSSSEVFTA